MTPGTASAPGLRGWIKQLVSRSTRDPAPAAEAPGVEPAGDRAEAARAEAGAEATLTGTDLGQALAHLAGMLGAPVAVVFGDKNRAEDSTLKNKKRIYHGYLVSG